MQLLCSKCEKIIYLMLKNVSCNTIFWQYSLVIAGNRRTKKMTLPLFHINGCNVSPNRCAEHHHMLFYKVMNKLMVDRNANLTEGRNAHSNSQMPAQTDYRV